MAWMLLLTGFLFVSTGRCAVHYAGTALRSEGTALATVQGSRTLHMKGTYILGYDGNKLALKKSKDWSVPAFPADTRPIALPPGPHSLVTSYFAKERYYSYKSQRLSGVKGQMLHSIPYLESWTCSLKFMAEPRHRYKVRGEKVPGKYAVHFVISDQTVEAEVAQCTTFH